MPSYSKHDIILVRYPFNERKSCKSLPNIASNIQIFGSVARQENTSDSDIDFIS